MNIRAKLTLRFTLIVASILVLFSLAVYIVSAQFRLEEFYARLESRALTTARLLIVVDEVSVEMLRIIDKNSVPALPQETVLIFNKNDSLAYSSPADVVIDIRPELFHRIRREKKIRYSQGDLEFTGFVYGEGKELFVVIASAFDRYGRSKLHNLGTVLLVGLAAGIGIIVLAGRIFALQVLTPLAKINNEVSSITAGNLDRRIDEGNRQDEIARLAMNFNQMLKRLEAAFDVQQSFVSNASHELRTPLAAIRSQLQVTLAKERQPEQYRQVLQSLLDDTNTFAKLTTSLLTLAQSGMDNQRLHFANLRVDELLFAAQEELARLHPGYHFQFDYNTLPEDETALTVLGNEQLLTTAFLNFMDNACKFSADHTVHISLTIREKLIEIRFLDHGVGIPPGEEEKIFTPFYRAGNAQNIAKGHGIGLSLCQKIVKLHGGTIRLHSALGKGSVFTVQLPVGGCYPF